MENKFTDSFTQAYVHDGMYIDTEPDKFGRFFRATLKNDDINEAPWERADGHGPVSEWRNKDSKAPGERILYEDRGKALFYDYAEAVKIAKRDAWGTGKDVPGETKRQKAARAVEEDFNALRLYCQDQWWYVGIVISLHQMQEDEEVLLADHLASCWGFEANYPGTQNEYLTEQANELLEEALGNPESKRVLTTVE